MNRYQVRRRIDGDEWQDADDSAVTDILTIGYFDVEIPLAHMEEGKTALTSTHEVRVKPDLLIAQRPPLKTEDDGDVIWA